MDNKKLTWFSFLLKILKLLTQLWLWPFTIIYYLTRNYYD